MRGTCSSPLTFLQLAMGDSHFFHHPCDLMNISSFMFCVDFLPGTAAVEWEETQPTLDHEMDSYQFSSPEVVIAATSMNKCDAAVQELSRNKKVIKEPAKIKTYTRAQMNIKRKAMQNGANRTENKEGKQDGNSDAESVEQGSGKILICQNGRLSSTQEATNEGTKCPSNARSTKRMQVKQKCFGKQLTERKLKKTISSIDHQNRAQVDDMKKQKFENLEFSVEDDDTNVPAANDVNIEEKSFTRLRSRDSRSSVPEVVRPTGTGNKEHSHDGTVKAVKSAPKTRAQKRNFQGTPMSSTCESISQNEPNILRDVAGERMSDEQEKKKITKNNQETPIKPQGWDKNC